MSGEGTGGGGALTLLLAMWLVGIVFLLGDRLHPEEPAVAGDPAGIVEPVEEIAGPDPVATPEPLVQECASAKECDGLVTRADIAVAFARAFELPLTTVDFFDDDDGLPAEAEINRVAAAGLTSGCGDREYCPDRLVTRGQLATFLDRTVELPPAERDWFEDTGGIVHENAINRLAQAGLVEGCGPDAYCPDEPVTRGELVTFLQRILAFEPTV
jgi:hypothetical protein